MAATMPLRSAPSFSMVSMVDSRMPVSAPFHPACAAPITRAPGRRTISVRSRPRWRRCEALGAGDDGVRKRPAPCLAMAPWSPPHRANGSARRLESARRDAQLFRHPRRFSSTWRGIVVGADAAVETAIDAAGHPALAVKKAWRRPGMAERQRRFQLHGAAAWRPACRPARRGIRPRRLGGLGDREHLEHRAMPPRPPPISRFSAPEMSSETSFVAFAIRVTARVSMPSRLRKSPCGTGPWTRAPRSSAARTSAWKSTWAVTSAWPGFFRGR